MDPASTLPFNPWIAILAPIGATLLQKAKGTYAYRALGERVQNLSQYLSLALSTLTSLGLIAVTLQGSATAGWELTIKIPPVHELGHLLANLVAMHMGQAAVYHTVIAPREARRVEKREGS